MIGIRERGGGAYIVDKFDLKKYPMFKFFEPTEGKLMYVAKKLMEEYLYLDDPNRDYVNIHRILNYYVMNPQSNILFEIGNFDGLLGFAGIVTGYKAAFLFKLWGKEKWGPDLVRQSRELIMDCFDDLKLVRLETQTADPRIIRMGKMVGFQVEGVKKRDFLFDGKWYDNTQMAIVREGE